MRITFREKGLRLACIAFAILWSGFPIFLVVMSSFKQGNRIFETPPSFLFAPTFENYRLLWTENGEYFSTLLNSFIIALGATVLTVAVTFPAGYVYSRARSGTLTVSAFFMLFVRMLPPIVITLPLFPLVNNIGMNDTYLFMILIYSTFYVSLGTWIMKTFIDQIPRELDEAAVIDGATLPQVLLRIILPLSGQGIVTTAIFVFVFAWNEFIFALIFTGSSTKTAPIIISEILSAVEGVQWGIMFAAATIHLVPILIFVLVVQKFIIAGLSAGSIKG